jgi:hypothetical protein
LLVNELLTLNVEFGCTASSTPCTADPKKSSAEIASVDLVVGTYVDQTMLTRKHHFGVTHMQRIALPAIVVIALIVIAVLYFL